MAMAGAPRTYAEGERESDKTKTELQRDKLGESDREGERIRAEWVEICLSIVYCRCCCCCCCVNALISGHKHFVVTLYNASQST